MTKASGKKRASDRTKPSVARNASVVRKRGPYKKSRKTRGAILAAALAEVGEVGFQATTVEAIARRAGVAIGNLYYHFASRDEIIDQLLRRLLDQRLEIELQTAKASGSFFDRVESRLRDYVAFVRRNPTYMRLFEDLRLHRPDIYTRSLEATLSLTRRELREAGERGEIRVMDERAAAVVAYLVLGASYFIDQMIDGLDGQDHPDDDLVVAEYMAFLRRGLGAVE